MGWNGYGYPAPNPTPNPTPRPTPESAPIPTAVPSPNPTPSPASNATPEPTATPLPSPVPSVCNIFYIFCLFEYKHFLFVLNIQIIGLMEMNQVHYKEYIEEKYLEWHQKVLVKFVTFFYFHS